MLTRLLYETTLLRESLSTGQNLPAGGHSSADPTRSAMVPYALSLGPIARSEPSLAPT